MSALRCLLAAALLMQARAAVAEEERPPQDHQTDFALLYPELAGDPEFRVWLERYGFGRWRELRRSGNARPVVVVQAPGAIDRAPIFAAEIRRDLPVPKVGRKRPFRTNEVKDAYSKSRKAVAEAPEGGQPVVDFDSMQQLSWDFSVPLLPNLTPVIPHDCTDGADDALSSDDLHHCEDPTLLDMALRTVVDPDDVLPSAESLCHYVYDFVRQNTYTPAQFYTISDQLVCSWESGVCDEKAVLLVSLLRVLGIKSRMKHLVMRTDSSTEWHAIVEYEHQGSWYHLDPTRDLVHDEGYYRRTPIRGLKVKSVEVYDVDWPADARTSNAITNDVIDDNVADGKLNRYDDFCRSGPYSRKGYSKN